MTDVYKRQGGHACRIDDHAALTAGIGLTLQHRLGRQPDHVEGANQVDVDRPRKGLQLVRPVAADHLLGRRHAGTVDQSVQPTENRICRIYGVDRRCV